MIDYEDALRGSPYLMDEVRAKVKFDQLLSASRELQLRAVRENQRIASEAAELIGPYLATARSELVTESNEIEGYVWKLEDAKEAILRNQELLSAPIRTLVACVREDPRVYEVLGLYKAHELADEWASQERTPSAHEIRQLHSVIVGDVEYAGRYKQYPNSISGSAHKTAQPFDVARVMLLLADWWADASTDPVLTATVIHAWLAHVHPFEDGNGRLARVLANLELARHGYPPLILRAQSDRGEYYAALALSDEGDLLPLYELFVRAIRRQVRLMASPNYVRDLINDQFLSTQRQRYNLWMSALDLWTRALKNSVSERGTSLHIAGTPTLSSFSLLAARNADGNGWFATLGRPYDEEWLLWFGYRSDTLHDMNADDFTFPSMFISRRDRTEGAPHPFSPMFDTDDLSGSLPDEISIFPARHDPVCLLRSWDDDWLSYVRAADQLSDILCPVVIE